MFQYVLALLLINTYYQSAAAPDRTGNVIPTRNLISNSLTLLASQCGNKLLVEQINSKIEECKLPGYPPYNEKQFQCLMFYDINTQLCSAVITSKLVIKEDFSAKINDQININTLCTLTNEWVFRNLTEYPVYKSLTDNIKLPALCGEICGYSDLANKDTNFYCKYYKLGVDALKNLLTSTSNIVSSDPQLSQEASADIAVSQGINIASSTQKLNIPDVQKDGTKLPVTGYIPNAQVADHPQPIIPEVPGSVVAGNRNIASGQEITDTAHENTTYVIKNTGSAQGSGTIQGNAGVMQGIPEAQSQTTKQTPSSSNYDVAGNLESVDPSLPPITKSSTKKTNIVSGVSKDGFDTFGNVEDNAENPDKALDGLEDPDEDEDENLDDTLDGVEQKNTNPFKTANIEVIKNEFARIETDEYNEDGDNFFPFFLTAVILVILLYVLHHNKNKVSKVFFGLVLEGASGRRRSSRGHAYRRLDTLEQAMTANTGAPPSKIIY